VLKIYVVSYLALLALVVMRSKKCPSPMVLTLRLALGLGITWAGLQINLTSLSPWTLDNVI
jgi:hypothetical protein